MFQDSSDSPRSLTEADVSALEKQDSRPVTEFKANKFEAEAQKHWDIFYKRNTTKFFKDRHWTQREFDALSGLDQKKSEDEKTVLLEVGCGVGNFVFPLIEEHSDKLYAYACDFSPRAVEFVKQNPNYDESKIKAFQCDISKADSLADTVKNVNLLSLVFVLSAIHPSKFLTVCQNLHAVMAEGGLILFRDYAVNDMAMIRFGAGTKISEKHYLRQDGTMSYFFNTEELREVLTKAGFKIKELHYVHRKTVNVKEQVDADRLFVQGVFQK